MESLVITLSTTCFDREPYKWINEIVPTLKKIMFTWYVFKYKACVVKIIIIITIIITIIIIIRRMWGNNNGNSTSHASSEHSELSKRDWKSTLEKSLPK